MSSSRSGEAWRWLAVFINVSSLVLTLYCTFVRFTVEENWIKNTRIPTLFSHIYVNLRLFHYKSLKSSKAWNLRLIFFWRFKFHFPLTEYVGEKNKALRFHFLTGQQNFQVKVKIKLCSFEELDLMKLKFRVNILFFFCLFSFSLISGIEHGLAFWIVGSDLCHWKNCVL